MKRTVLFSLLLLLTACAQPLPSSAYKPANPDFYKDMRDGFFLRGKLVVGEVKNTVNPKDIITGTGYGQALTRIYGESHLLAYKDDALEAANANGNPLLTNEHARYTLSAEIVDYRISSHGFMHVTGGSAVVYSLTDNNTQQEVFRKTVTATLEIKKGFFEDAGPLLVRAMAESLGENAAQSVRELAQLDAAELGAKPTTKKTYTKGAKK